MFDVSDVSSCYNTSLLSMVATIKGTSPSKGESSGTRKAGRFDGLKSTGSVSEEHRVTVIHTGEKVKVKDEMLDALEKLKVVRFPLFRIFPSSHPSCTLCRFAANIC